MMKPLEALPAVPDNGVGDFRHTICRPPGETNIIVLDSMVAIHVLHEQLK